MKQIVKIPRIFRIHYTRPKTEKQMTGWIRIHRILMSKPIWLQSTPEQKVILITLLMMANHTEKEWIWKGKKFKAEPGQFVTSLDSIKKACGKGVTNQNIRTALEKFQNLEFLTDESTKTGRLVTIVNWASYQIEDDEVTKTVTKNQQRGNKEVTPNNNDKNDNKELEAYASVGVPPPSQEELNLIEMKKTFIALPKTKKNVYEFIRDNRPPFIEPYVSMWNIWAAERGKAKIETLTDKRKRHFNARMKEGKFDLLGILAKATKSDACLQGQWFTWDWITKSADNYLKVLEGNYDNNKPEMTMQKPQLSTNYFNFDGQK